MLTVTTGALGAVAIVVTLLIINRRDRRMLALRTSQLADSEARWRPLPETVPPDIFPVSPCGRPTYVSPKLPQITGDPNSGPGDARAWLVHEPDMPLVRETW